MSHVSRRPIVAVTAILAAGVGAVVITATSAAATSPPVGHPTTTTTIPAAARQGIAALLARDGAAAKTVRHQFELTASDGAKNDYFGEFVAASANTIVVGAEGHVTNGNQYQGAAYVFSRPATGWAHASQTAELTLSDGAADDSFGSAVAIAGNTIVIGASMRTVDGHTNEGAAFVYVEPKTGWKSTGAPTATLSATDGAASDGFGWSVAISGPTVVVGARNHASKGSAYVYTRPKAGWKSMTQTAELTGSDTALYDSFGASVAASGNTVVVSSQSHTDGSAESAGEVYAYAKPDHGWTSGVETRRLLPTDITSNEEFGDNGELAMAGSTVVVGADNDAGGYSTSGAGSAYVFTEPKAGWGTTLDPPLAQTAKLTPTGPGAGDNFGNVGISGGTVIVGEDFGLDGQASQKGKAYLFSRPQAGWKNATQTSTLSASDGTVGDYFGRAVAISGSTALVGANLRHGGTGVTYVFAPPGPTLTNVKQSHHSWRPSTAKPATNSTHTPAGGSVFSFTASEQATVTMSFSEKSKHGGYRHRGTVTIHANAGTTKEYVGGKLGKGRRLSAGRCEVAVTASNANGTTRRSLLHFTVKAAKPKGHKK